LLYKEHPGHLFDVLKLYLKTVLCVYTIKNPNHCLLLHFASLYSYIKIKIKQNIFKHQCVLETNSSNYQHTNLWRTWQAMLSVLNVHMFVFWKNQEEIYESQYILKTNELKSMSMIFDIQNSSLTMINVVVLSLRVCSPLQHLLLIQLDQLLLSSGHQYISI
jgi:hypothetical protein